MIRRTSRSAILFSAFSRISAVPFCGSNSIDSTPSSFFSALSIAPLQYAQSIPASLNLMVRSSAEGLDGNAPRSTHTALNRMRCLIDVVYTLVTIETENRNTSRTRDVALLFLKLGTIGFGGPAAHIAMMEDEVVRRRRWLTREQFLDYLGATNLIPGPNSTELALHIGHARAGWPGLLVAGACFILPATLIVAAIGWGYVRYGRLPEAQGILYGIKPVVIAVVLQALWALGRSAVKSRWLAVVGLAALVAAALGAHELAVL